MHLVCRATPDIIREMQPDWVAEGGLINWGLELGAGAGTGGTVSSSHTCEACMHIAFCVRPADHSPAVCYCIPSCIVFSNDYQAMLTSCQSACTCNYNRCNVYSSVQAGKQQAEQGAWD